MNQEAKYNELSTWLTSQNITNIRIIWGPVSNTDLVDLYQQSHVFVLPTKGEGWGLPLIEAAAVGLPIITTWHSAHTEFLQHIRSSVITVEHNMAPITCAEYQYFYPAPDGNWGNWAQPRIDSIRQALRTARDNYATLAQQARTNSDIIRRDFTWAQSANHALKVLQKHNILK